MNNNKYFAYIRKSTDVEDKQELSLDAQKRIINEYILRNKITIAKWFEEKLSARKKGRPAFNELIEKLEANGISGVICHKPDRLTRNLWDSARINEMMELVKSLWVFSGERRTYATIEDKKSLCQKDSK